jgi:GNAT superfamily N-acetyltransferase
VRSFYLEAGVYASRISRGGIRRYTADDPHPPGGDRECPARPGADYAADVCRFLEKDGRGWVALVDGDVVAFSYASLIDGSIWALFVDPRFEGQGLGKQLLSLATDWLFSLGFRQVTLSTGTHTRAAQFYTRLGWRPASSGAGDSVFVLDGP